MGIMRNWMIFCVCLLVLISSSSTTLSKSDKKKKNKDSIVSQEQQQQSLSPLGESLVTERGLVTENPTYKQILQNHHAYSTAHAATKQFPAVTLAYVTPWHNKGYDHASTFGSKFSIVSPVWLQLRPATTETGFTITGGHDIDSGWMSRVKSKSAVKMMPRIVFEDWTSQSFHQLFTNQYVANGCTQTVVQFLQQHKFDGAVIEVWSMLGGHRNKELQHFVSHLGRDLHSVGLSIVLVIPPPIIANQISAVFTKENFDALSENVDYFSLMTYDFGQNSQSNAASANAPIDWMRSCVETLVPDTNRKMRQKILLGLNFYGYDFVPGNVQAIIGSTYLQILKKHKPDIIWNSAVKEHFIQFTTGIGTHVLAYPTLASIKARVDLATSLGTGLSIWEIGQGLDYFFDLL